MRKRNFLCLKSEGNLEGSKRCTVFVKTSCAVICQMHQLIQRTYWRESAVMQVQNLGVPLAAV